MKQTLNKNEMARRMAQELNDGDVVNLGIGIPALASGYLSKGIQVTFHVENGVFGFGRVLTEKDADQMDYYLTNMAGQFLEARPGMCIVDFAEAFDAIRTGRVNVTMLGAYQVSEKGDIASWTTTASIDDVLPSTLTLGGAMDMPIGPPKVVIGMTHVDKKGRPKIVHQCNLPLSAAGKASLIITDVAVVGIKPEGLELLEIAPGWTPEEVQAMTEPKLNISKDIRYIFGDKLA